ncbi:hypothetical protein GCM10023093_21020 [Nemorincola caseinilytica]|uniref:Secreted protein n=1 Tax=Nemorincola caseinilytica TaxID=2054315 RepID=A0ABP8NHU9_9BACT
MFRYLKIALFVTVAMLASGVWSVADTRAFAGTVHGLSDTHHTFSCAGDIETERQLVDDTIQPDEAARINRRYHERLAALFSIVPHSGHCAVAQVPTLNSDIIYGIACSSHCLSTCYQYIFRLSPF